MSNAALTERIRIFDRQGFELAQFRANSDRSWVIGKEGRASFTYPSRITDIVNETVLRFKNYILIENSRLPAWVGIIDTPRDWNEKNVIVSAYTPERLFSIRNGTGEEKMKGSAGVIFGNLINLINKKEPTILQAGNIWGGGDVRETTVTPATIDKNLFEIQERSLEEYEFVPSFVASKLVITANWYERLGQTVQCPLVSARKGGNVEKMTMTEDDRIVNRVLGYGDGISWVSRPKKTNTDDTGLSKYGLCENGQNWNGVAQINAIESNNLDYLKKHREARRIFQISVLNVGDTFDYIRLGNILPLKVDNLGFYDGIRGTITNVRIIGMSYSRKDGQKVKLITEEVL